MTAPLSLRRATLLGVVVVAAACDVAQFISDPMPRFEQTWNVPASSDTITIASLLPSDNSVRVLPDSSGFSLSPSTISISKVVGSADACSTCLTLHGTTAPKPSFSMIANNSSALATDVTSADILSGTVNVALTNNMSFDPLRVTTGAGTQGHMIILIRSGSVVFGRDSVNGATTPWAPNTVLNRVIPLNSGTAPGSLAAEVTLVSPTGDSTFINANGTLDASAAVPALNVAAVNLNVVNRQMTSDTTEFDLTGVEDFSDNVVQGSLQMTITNPLAISGNVDVRFIHGPLPTDVVSKQISMPTGTSQRRDVTLTRADLDQLFGKTVTVVVTGLVNSAGPITITPRLKITISNRMILTIRTGGGQ